MRWDTHFIRLRVWIFRSIFCHLNTVSSTTPTSDEQTSSFNFAVIYMRKYLRPFCTRSDLANCSLCRDTSRRRPCVHTCPWQSSAQIRSTCETRKDCRPASNSCRSPPAPTCTVLSSNRRHLKSCAKQHNSIHPRPSYYDTHIYCICQPGGWINMKHNINYCLYIW